jgi:hypothetical protein
MSDEMNELEPIRRAISVSLAIMEAAPLNLYSRKITKDTVKAWLIAVRNRGIANAEVIEKTCEWFVSNVKDFPSPAEFCTKALQLQTENRVAIAEDSEDGAVRIIYIDADMVADRCRRRGGPKTFDWPEVPVKPLALPDPISDEEFRRRKKEQVELLKDA